MITGQPRRPRAITTQVFFKGDEYLDSDAVFGVRKSLIAEAKHVPKDANLEFTLDHRPDARVDFDFVLSPARA